MGATRPPYLAGEGTCCGKMPLQDRFILVQKLLKSMHFFYKTHFHELPEAPLCARTAHSSARCPALLCACRPAVCHTPVDVQSS